MLYLISPPGSVHWNSIPADILETFREHGADLARLEWLPAEERQFDQDLLQLALRRGHPCSSGIVIDASEVVTLGRGDEIRRTHANVEQAQQNLRANNELMERIFPGWTAHGEELNVRIAASSEQAASRADLEAADLLTGDPDTALLEHWRSLGGWPPAQDVTDE